MEDREQAVEALKEQIQAGDVQPIREWLQAAVEESEGESAEKAAELITRLDALVKEQKLLSGSEKQFGIYQITARKPEHDYRFMNLDFVKRHNHCSKQADGKCSGCDSASSDTSCRSGKGTLQCRVGKRRTDWHKDSGQPDHCAGS